MLHTRAAEIANELTGIIKPYCINNLIGIPYLPPQERNIKNDILTQNTNTRNSN